MQAEVDSCVMSLPDLTSSSQAACGSGSLPSSSDRNSKASELDSESSKDTTSEKRHHQDQEKGEIKHTHQSERKEGEGGGIGKKRRVFREEKDEASFASTKSPTGEKSMETRKRLSRSASIVDHEADTEENDDAPCKKRRLLSGSIVGSDSVHLPESTGLTVSQLLEHVQTVKRKGLHTEYAHIQVEPLAGTFSHSRALHNVPKNRYTDVLCYDHSRVTLSSTAGVTTADYINASLVDGYMQKNAYISTQGPLPKTAADFWRMVWQYRSQVIVMTTRTVERQRLKCGQYWPFEEQSEEQFQEFRVSNQSVKSFNHYVETKLALSNTTTGERREVYHLQFISWPDFGVPPAASFLDFLFYVRHLQETATHKLGRAWTGHPGGPPVVVHCSAGIGRTGTFIAIDICLRRLENIGTIDIPVTVRRIRSQRAFSIQTPDQYVFCHLAVIEHAIRTGLLTHVESFVLDSSESDDSD